MAVRSRSRPSGPPVDRVQLRERVDVLLGDAPPLGDAVERAGHRRGHDVAVEALHDVEGRADDRLVRAGGEDLGDPCAALEGAQHAGFAQDVVSAGRERRRPAQDELGAVAPERVGDVGMAVPSGSTSSSPAPRPGRRGTPPAVPGRAGHPAPRPRAACRRSAWRRPTGAGTPPPRTRPGAGQLRSAPRSRPFAKVGEICLDVLAAGAWMAVDADHPRVVVRDRASQRRTDARRGAGDPDDDLARRVRRRRARPAPAAPRAAARPGRTRPPSRARGSPGRSPRTRPPRPRERGRRTCRSDSRGTRGSRA